MSDSDIVFFVNQKAVLVCFEQINTLDSPLSAIEKSFFVREFPLLLNEAI